MESTSPPFETMVFVCTHQRNAGERIACANPGRDGTALLESLRKCIKEQGLEGKVRICKSGCMDRCEEGPNALVFRAGCSGEWAKGISVQNINDLLRLIKFIPQPAQSD